MTDPQRVLFAYRDDIATDGGAAAVMHNTAAALERLGVEAEVTYDLAPDPSDFDLVHAVNLWEPETALEQLRHLRAAGAAVVWQPFYLGYSELTWAMRALHAVFEQRRSPGEVDQLVKSFSDIEVAGITRYTPNEPRPGFNAGVNEMVELADRIVVCSMHEAQLLSQDVGLDGTPFTHTPHGVEAPRFADASGQAFRAHAGLGEDPFVLCVGAIDHRKNQVMLAHALRGSGLTLVLLGPALEPSTLELVKSAGGGSVVHIDRVPAELVASAYHAAAVHALPSWAEGAALVNLEAAAAGCPIVVSDRSSEFEYFGELAAYCNPADGASIRGAVERSLDAREGDAERLSELRDRMRDLTWDKTAGATLNAYREVLADRGRGAPAKAARQRSAPVTPRLREAAGPPMPAGRQIPVFLRDVAEAIPAGARVLDVSAPEPARAELFEHADYVRVGRAEELPSEDASFDFVVLTGALEYTADATTVVGRLHRLLRPGGQLHISTQFVRELDEVTPDFLRYTAWGLERILRHAGFAAVDIAPAADCFSALAQAMTGIASTMGSYPDGRDRDRAAAARDLRATGERIARLEGLDVRRALPLGYRAIGLKAPLAIPAAGARIEGVRAFATLAYAGELLFDPTLLRAYGERFGAADDATLVIYAPHVDPGELEQRLLDAAGSVGMAGEEGADLLAMPFAAAAPDEPALAAGIDAVLSLNPPRGAFRLVPHFHHASADELRAAAELRWTG